MTLSKFPIIAVAVLLALKMQTAQAVEKPDMSPRRMILDTDMLTDCDDAAALAMLHVLQDRGEIQLLGVLLNGVDTTGKHSGVVSAINAYFGRSKLPIGVSRRKADTSPAKKSSYATAVWEEFPHDGKTDADRPEAVELYRKLLSAAPDHSVTIISIGFLTNLEDLLRDEKGAAIVASKAEQLVVMGGAYPAGKEYNFRFAGAGKATSFVLENWPKDVPMVFLGYELGQVVKTGKAYQDASASPMRRCYEIAYDSIKKGRPSWDQTAILFAARGTKYDGKTYFKEVSGGHNVIHPDGSNQWVPSKDSTQPNSNQSYLQLATTPEQLAAEIEQLMVTPPSRR